MNIGTVVEGPSDRLVLQAILNKLCPGEHRYIPLQPPTTFGETGTGWKGVRLWCRQSWQRPGSSLDKLLSGETGPSLDLLVIQVDAEIATEPDLQEGDESPISQVQQACPPITPTAIQLNRVVEHWLHRAPLPPQVILAIPAQNTENWTFAALFPDDELCRQHDYECSQSRRNHPGYRLTFKKYGKLLQRTDGTVKKSRRQYEQVIPQIAAEWDTVCRICSQAQQFTQEVLAFLAATSL